MKELRLGKVKSQELAKWFGMSYGSFRVNKQSKLEELKLYCDFVEVYGGINITNIYDYNNVVYHKATRKNYEIVKSSFDEEWDKSGIDTCSNVAIKIYNKHKNELTVVDTTAYNYVIQVRNELYGKPFENIGSLGDCIYLWCRKEYDKNTDTVVYTEFTQEEQELKKKLMKKYFSTDVEKEVIVAEMVNNGEISKEKAYDVLCEMKNLNAAGFMAFKAELESELGCRVAKATLLRKNQDAEMRFFDEEDQKLQIGDGK